MRAVGGATDATVGAERSFNFSRLGHAPAIKPCQLRSIHGIGDQFAAGLVSAWTVGLIAYYAFDDPSSPDSRVKGDVTYTPNANTAFALGTWIASTAGVYVSAPPEGDCGSLLKTLVGTTVPSVPLFFGRHQPLLRFIGVLIVAPLQALGGTLAY